MLTIAGLATARGLVSGPVYLYRGDEDIPVSEYAIPVGREGDEFMRLKKATADVGRDLETLIGVLSERSKDGQDAKVFEGHLMILEDPILKKEIGKLVVERRINAEAAVKRGIDKFRKQFQRMNDEYFRERVRDLDDVERRLLRALTGFTRSPHLDMSSPCIVVADDLTPSETVQLPRDKVLGFATNGGSTTSHVALLARAMGIPCVTGLGCVTQKVRPGAIVLLDGTAGTITVDPDEQAIAAFEALVRKQHESEQVLHDGKPAGTLKDGGEVKIFANVHPGVPFGALKDMGARGVGLYRSEYLWLNGEKEPDEETQFEAYKAIAEYVRNLSPDAHVTIRALDIGGDKTVRGITVKENNPFLGNRSIRYLLSAKDVFRRQLRAILRASAFGRIKIMYPMVSCVEEMREAAVVMEEVKRELDEAGVRYDREIQVGAMIEVPAAAINARAIAKYCKFFSIGTNDLVQYTMAADRSNEEVAHLYQPTHPAVLTLMQHVIKVANELQLPVSVCGESASDPIVGVLWASMGTDVLSMSATYIPLMSKILRRLTRSDLDEYRELALSMNNGETGNEILDACRQWMERKIPDLETLLI